MNFTPDLDLAIDQWFKEDIREGDHTTLSIIPPTARGHARLLVKQQGILAGVEVAERILHRFDPELELEGRLRDGTPVRPGEVAFTVAGNTRSILHCERLVLNVMQRMSGIATLTGAYAARLEGTGARILDTRKTTPGFRMLEKEAVRLGGGANHRFGLFDLVLVKDNHIDFAGGIARALERVHHYLEKHRLELDVEVETRSLEDVTQVAAMAKSKEDHVVRLRRIMFDNFSLEQTREAVRIIEGALETESSGGINLDTIRGYAECGVDYISVGAVTHQARSLDLSLKAVSNAKDN